MIALAKIASFTCRSRYDSLQVLRLLIKITVLKSFNKENLEIIFTGLVIMIVYLKSMK